LERKKNQAIHTLARTLPILLNAEGMYQNYFGLREMPFNITPNPDFLFRSPTHEDALQHLRYGILEKKGFIVLTGEVGCGKTTLCRTILSELSPDQFDTALILNTRLSETQLIRAIVTELGVETKARSKLELIDILYQHLLERIHQGRQIVVFIDEAQNLPFEVLEQVRLLSNLEADDQKLMQIVLIGQPELDGKLREKRLRQLRQRILVYYKLKSLSCEETARYIDHRLLLAGAGGEPLLTPWAIRKIHRKSHGIPRLINNICDKAFLAAFVRGKERVTTRDVRRAIRELDDFLLS